MDGKRSRAISKGKRAAHRKRVAGDKRPRQFPRKCTLCGKIKHVDLDEPGFSEFSLVRKKLKSGVVATYPKAECRECSNKRTRAWRERQRESGELNRRQKEWDSRRDMEATLAWRKNYRQTKRLGFDPQGEFYWSREFGTWLRSQVNRTLGGGVAIGSLAPVADKPRLSQVAEDTGIALKRLEAFIRKDPPPVEVREADKLVTYFHQQERLWELLSEPFGGSVGEKKLVG